MIHTQLFWQDIKCSGTTGSNTRKIFKLDIGIDIYCYTSLISDNGQNNLVEWNKVLLSSSALLWIREFDESRTKHTGLGLLQNGFCSKSIVQFDP